MQKDDSTTTRSLLGHGNHISFLFPCAYDDIYIIVVFDFEKKKNKIIIIIIVVGDLLVQKPKLIK